MKNPQNYYITVRKDLKHQIGKNGEKKYKLYIRFSSISQTYRVSCKILNIMLSEKELEMLQQPNSKPSDFENQDIYFLWKHENELIQYVIDHQGSSNFKASNFIKNYNNLARNGSIKKAIENLKRAFLMFEKTVTTRTKFGLCSKQDLRVIHNVKIPWNELTKDEW